MTRRDTRDDGRIGIDIDRRTFLKTTAVTGVGLGGTAALSGSAAAQTTVSGGGDALQTAIDGASDGETIVVTDSETYDPIVVDKSLRIETDADPTIEGEGGITSTVSIEADDVTVDGFTITNPGGLIGVKVQPKDRSAGVGYDGATITNNTIEDLGPTESLGVSGIIVGNGSYDDIEITNNTIRDLENEIGEPSQFDPTVNGILFDADNASPETITDVTVVNNEISGLTSDVAPLGIVVQHETENVTINNNEINDLTASIDSDSDDTDDGQDQPKTFAQGINIGSPSTSETVINGNTIEDVVDEDEKGDSFKTTEGFYGEAVKLGDEADPSGLTVRANQFLAAVGVNNAAPETLDAKSNYWGSRQGPEEVDSNLDSDDDDRADVVGNVDFEPFRRNPPGGSGGGNGRGN